MQRLSFFLLALACSISAYAVRLPAVINSHMVLQRDMQVPIWGWGDAGEKISVHFAGQKKETTAGKNGEWMVKLNKLKANASPSVLTVKGNNEIKLENVLVGEVWICSGQSNMEWSVARCANPKEEIAKANHPKIRLFDVPGHTVHPLPQREGKGEWKVCSSQSVAGFSATGYYFGRRIQQALGVPVGLIGSNWGGTRIEPWTTLDGFKSVPELSDNAKRLLPTPRTQKWGVALLPPSIIRWFTLSLLTPYVEPFGIRESLTAMRESLIIKRNTLSSKVGEKPFKTLTLDSTGYSCATSESPM